MRVGIDYRPALLAKTGIGRYAEGLVRGLLAAGMGESLRLWGVFRTAERFATNPALAGSEPGPGTAPSAARRSPPSPRAG